MSANINPLGLSESVKSTIINNIDGLVHYPDPQARELKSAIASRYSIALENILTLNGAAEFFYLFFNTFRPRQVLIPVPSFSEYERAAKAASCGVKRFITYADTNFNIDSTLSLRPSIQKRSAVLSWLIPTIQPVIS